MSQARILIEPKKTPVKLIQVILVALFFLSPVAHGQIFTDGQTILPKVNYALFPQAEGAVEVPPSPRLNLPEGEGTIEFWAQPSWGGSGGPAFYSILTNGRTVHRRAEDGTFERFFDARYAIYLTRTSIVLQCGDELKATRFVDFDGVPPLSTGLATHFAIATKGDLTTIYVDGRTSVNLEFGYGSGGGNVVTIGGIPEGAVGKVRQRRNQAAFNEFLIEDSADFGPFQGSIGGVRIWDRRLDHEALLSLDTSDMPEPSPLRLYGQFHAERDLAFKAVAPGRTHDVHRADLVAFSQFDKEIGSQVAICDSVEGNWINASSQQPFLGSVPSSLKEFEPLTVIDDHPLLNFVPKPGSGQPAGIYDAYVNGDLAGSLVRRELVDQFAYDFVDLRGQSHPVKVRGRGDQLTLEGVVPELGPNDAGRIDLMRSTSRSKGTAAPSSDVFLAGMRVSDIEFSLKSYDIMQLHPFEFWKGSPAVTGSDQWIFERGHSDEWQLAFGSNSVMPLGFYLDSHGESQGTMAGTTTTTEREVYNAIRAKFGVQGGSPAGVTAGASGEFNSSDSFKQLTTSVSTLGSSWAKWGTIMVDPLFIRLSPEFYSDVERLLEDGRFASFIEKWGTHYPQGVSHGGVLYTQRTLDENDVRRTSEWGLDVSAFVQYGSSQDPAFKAEASFGQTRRTASREMLSMDDSTWSGAGISMMTTNSDMLVANIEPDQAIPISMDLRLIHELLSPMYFDDPRIFNGLRHDLAEAIVGYMRGDRPPDGVPVVEVPPLYDSLTMNVRLKALRHNANDGNGSAAEFWGKIQATAYANHANSLVFNDGGLASSPVVLWDTDSDDEWEVDEDDGDATFSSAPGAQDAYEADNGRHSHLKGPGQLAYRIDPEQILLEEFAVVIEADITEEDTSPDGDEYFKGGELTLKESDFRDSEGNLATSEYPEERLLKILEEDDGTWVEFVVEVFVETDSHPWRNPSTAAQAALERAIEESSPKVRSRSARELVENSGVSSDEVLAYFPLDADGLRRPGSRWWQAENPVWGIDPSDFTVIVDLKPGDHHFSFALYPDHERTEGEDKRWWDVSHGISEGWEASKDAAADKLGFLRLHASSGGSHSTYLEEVVSVSEDQWYSVGASFRPDGFDWVIFSRSPLRQIASGSEETHTVKSSSMVGLLDFIELRRDVEPENRGGIDEVYVFDRALTTEEITEVVQQPRTAAPVVVRPVAFWPFDQQRNAAPAMMPFQGSLGRVRDDALTLFPNADEFEAPAYDPRDFTMVFDVQTTDSTRSILLEDELKLFQIRLFENADLSGLYVKMADAGAAWFLPDEISLAPYTGVKLGDYTPAPYSWQRVALTFDGLNLQLALDDGSGWIQSEKTLISSDIRDQVAARVESHGKKPVRWSVRAEYHHPGTKLRAVEGFYPDVESEIALFDELRFFRGAMSEGEISRAMLAPRRFEPPSQETQLVGYFPLGVPEVVALDDSQDLLEALVDPVLRDALARPIEGLSASQVSDSALLLSNGEPVRLSGAGMPVSDFTLHFDFLPGEGDLSVRRGPIEFTCEAGRTLLKVGDPEDGGLVYDPAFGDQISAGDWHKLVLAVDGWDSSLRVFLDGESFGRIPLGAPVVAALRASDKLAPRWRIEGSVAEGGSSALVDELILLSPALGAFDLEALAARQRERGGAVAPRKVVVAQRTTVFDEGGSDLRSADEEWVEDLLAYYPLDGSLEERSGFGGRTLGEGSDFEPEFSDDAVSVGDDLLVEVPGLDLEGFTVAAWVAPTDAEQTLLTFPGASVRVGAAVGELRDRLEEAVRMGILDGADVQRALSDPEFAIELLQTTMSDESLGLSMFETQTLSASLMFVSVFRGIHHLEVVFESTDGRTWVEDLEFQLLPKQRSFLSLPKEEYVEALLDRIAPSSYGPGTWLSLVLTLDTKAGELRGMLDGRRLKPIALPEGFKLRAPDGSAPRIVGVDGSGEYGTGAMLDELIVMNATPLISSGMMEFFSRRPRLEGPAIEWDVEEGFLLQDVRFTISNAESLSVPNVGSGSAGAWDLEGIPRVVPGYSNRYQFVSHYNDDTKVWKAEATQDGARVVLAEGDPLDWQISAIEGTEAVRVQCVSPGVWNGSFLSIAPVKEQRTRSDGTVYDRWRFRFVLVREDPIPLRLGS